MLGQERLDYMRNQPCHAREYGHDGTEQKKTVTDTKAHELTQFNKGRAIAGFWYEKSISARKVGSGDCLCFHYFLVLF